MSKFIIMKKSVLDDGLEKMQSISEANEIHAAQAFLEGYPDYFHKNSWIRVLNNEVGWGIGKDGIDLCPTIEANAGQILSDLSVECDFDLIEFEER
ncbi:hypothetical protein FDW77_02480 [Listeria monocytogenes]|nr:hypothetical protein [Listeria monocytogenes]